MQFVIYFSNGMNIDLKFAKFMARAWLDFLSLEVEGLGGCGPETREKKPAEIFFKYFSFGLNSITLEIDKEAALRSLNHNHKQE